MTKLRGLVLVAALACAAAAGGGLAAANAPAEAHRTEGRAAGKTGEQGSARIDPRAGGFEIGLGEWALTPEARAIRPGPVTFVIRNRGRFVHGFEIEISRRDRDLDRDERVKAESMELRPGQATRMSLNLQPGVYDIECSVGDHDDMGMRGVLEVRADAPLVPARPAASPSTVVISGFAYKPPTLRTTVGRTVTWRNDDAAPHTATGKQFSSPQLGKGGSYRRRFMQPGTYSYVCALHPGMRGKVVVARRSAG